MVIPACCLTPHAKSAPARPDPRRAQDRVPPTLGLDAPDVGVDFNFVANIAQDKTVKVAVSNSFGFGGTNASLVFSKPS